MKAKLVRKLSKAKKIEAMCIQETKKEMVESILCMSQWDDGDLRWVASPSIGNSGGPNRLSNRICSELESIQFDPMRYS